MFCKKGNPFDIKKENADEHCKNNDSENIRRFSL